MSIPNGVVTVTTYGTLQFETVQSLAEMRSHTEALKLCGVQWTFVPGGLVDRARNQAVAEMLRTPAQWLLFVDGDCVFPPEALAQLLRYAYEESPTTDIVGAYNPLRGGVNLPTIDTGTGTWESHFPGEGPLDVMRTGSAFILIKRHVFERMEAPWYGTRHPKRPIDALAEVDNFARTKFDGRNPLREHPAWDSLFKCARDDASTYQPPDPAAFVGEDSNFTDRAKFCGFRVVVHTNVVCGHVDRRITTHEDHKTAMAQMERNRKWALGVLR